MKTVLARDVQTRRRRRAYYHPGLGGDVNRMWLDRLALSCDELGPVPSGVAVYLGKPFVYPQGSNIGDLIARGHEWDSVFRTTVPALLPSDEPTICEVGSNIGASLLQILAVKPRAHVLAFEPSDYFRAYLDCNLELAGFDHVEVIPQLLGRQSGPRYIYRR